MMKAHTHLMADQPQSPNSGRISSMLSDLNTQRQGAPVSPAPMAAPQRPALPGRPSAPPTNLPTTRPAPLAQTPQPPVAPFRPKEVVPQPVRSIVAPTPDERPVAPMPRPSAPPPPPREMAIPAAPVPPRPAAPAPIAPKPAAPVPPTPENQPKTYTSEMRVMSSDIGNITTGRPAVGIKPVPAPIADSKPVAPVLPATPVPPQPVITVIAAPPPSGGGIGRTIGLVLLSLAAVGILFWAATMLFGGSGTPQATATPTNSPSQTLAVTPKTLLSYFRQTGTAVELKADGTAPVDFANAVTISQSPLQQALRMPISGPFSSSLSQFLGAVANGAPTDLDSTLAADWAVLTYGQKEQFDTAGAPIISTEARTRLALITELKDISAATQAMTTWESDNLAMDMAHVFGYDATRAIVEGFSSGNYRNAPIRYWNFPYADTSIDWAIVTASNNKNYLVLTSSREAMFYTIDQLMQ